MILRPGTAVGDERGEHVERSRSVRLGHTLDRRPLVARPLTGSGERDRLFDGAGQFIRDPGLNYSSDGEFRLVSLALQLGGQEFAARPYEENPIVRACTKAHCGAAAKLKLELYQGDPSSKSTPVDHPFLKLLRRPTARMTGRQFWKRHRVFKTLFGEVFWLLADVDGNPVASDPATGFITSEPRQIILAGGDRIKVHRDTSTGEISEYQYVLNQGKLSERFPWSSVIAFLDFDPSNPDRGLGDVEAAVRPIDLQHAIFRYMDAVLRNGGDPGGILSYEGDVDLHELQRRQAILDDEMTVANRGRNLVVGGGAKWYANNARPKDMEFQMLWKEASTMIMQSMGVPPPVVGLYEDATMNNVDAAHREHWVGPNGVISRATEDLDVLQESAFPRLARAGAGYERLAELTASWNTDEVEALQVDKSEQIAAAQELAAAGIGITFNEGLEMLGCVVESPEEGDRKWITPTLRDLDEQGLTEDPEPITEVAPAAPGKPAAKAASVTNGHTFGQPCATCGGLHFSLSEPERRFGEALGSTLKAYTNAQVRRLRSIARGDGFAAEYGIDLDSIVTGADLAVDDLSVLLLDKDPWIDRFGEEVRPFIREAFVEAALQAYDDSGARGVLLDRRNIRALKFLSNQEVRLSEGVTSRLAARVRDLVAGAFTSEQIGSGKTLRQLIQQELPELTRELKRVFGNNEARAATIARTEHGIAANGGRWEQFGESGVLEIEWEPSPDDGNVRETHQLWGVRRAYGELFPNGLRYPHDPRGTAKELANCRCSFRATRFTDELDLDD